METLLYLAKVNAYWLLFYACYWLLLRKHTFFHWNRFYLLGTLLIAFALPVIHLDEPVKTIYVPETLYDNATISVTVMADKAPEKSMSGAFAVGFYLIVALVLAWNLISGISRLVQLARRSEQIDMGDFTLVLLPENTWSGSSFSFFRWLFLSAHDYRNNPDTVIRHECEHIRQWHTADVLLIELLKICFWMNPAVWLYKRSIETVHEYLADQPVPDRTEYASFLLAYAMRSPDIAIANHFFNSSLLKRRIYMIYKKRSSRWLLARYALVLPVVGCALAVSASKSPVPVNRENNAAHAQTIQVKGNVSDENNAPIADAIVIIAGTTRGTSTDRNGWFELDHVPANGKLVVTHVAFETQEVQLTASQPEATITMKKAVSQISGVVVVGSQIAKTESSKSGASPHSSATDDFKVVEKRPEFPGGREALMRYLLENLQHPEIARNTNVEAVALVSFTVDKNGEIRNARSLKNIGYGIDKEALRVVNEMPKWDPAVQNGKPVEMEYTLEVNFKLDKESRERRQGFLDINSKTVSPIPSMDAIGSLLGNVPDWSKAKKAPELNLWTLGYSFSRTPATEYLNAESGEYRYLNYGGAYSQRKAPVSTNLKFRSQKQD